MIDDICSAAEIIDYSYFYNRLALERLNDMELRCGLPLTSEKDYKPYGKNNIDNLPDYDIIEGRGRYIQDPKTGLMQGSKPSVEVSALGENHFEKGFSPENLKAHWGGEHDHSLQYPELKSAEEYNEYAIRLISSAADGKNILGYKMADGTVCRYNVKTNDYVKGNPIYDDIYTCFKPKSKAAYFHKKKKRRRRQKRMSKLVYLCPICGKYNFRVNGTNEICPFCGWINDSLQNNDHNSLDGENEISFNEHREKWLKKNGGKQQ